MGLLKIKRFLKNKIELDFGMKELVKNLSKNL
jgi:hypothetical protein